jgi:hypothetical protein
VGHLVERAEVVGGHDIDVGARRLRRPEEVAADAPKAVDPDTRRHGSLPSLQVVPGVVAGHRSVSIRPERSGP